MPRRRAPPAARTARPHQPRGAPERWREARASLATWCPHPAGTAPPGSGPDLGGSEPTIPTLACPGVLWPAGGQALHSWCTATACATGLRCGGTGFSGLTCTHSHPCPRGEGCVSPLFRCQRGDPWSWSSPISRSTSSTRACLKASRSCMTRSFTPTSATCAKH
uniref:Uncharacterized protein n=1 Tax=Myxococcus xanthus TaxID=34 RepID=Q93NB8_MYXXA|nr:unknown [Myxococcus xanthus DZF1]